jgi:hypothetical protein
MTQSPKKFVDKVLCNASSNSSLRQRASSRRLLRVFSMTRRRKRRKRKRSQDSIAQDHRLLRLCLAMTSPLYDPLLHMTVGEPDN